MKQDGVVPNNSESSRHISAKQTDANLEYQREVLKYITSIGSSLRLQMDTDTLLKRVSGAACKGLRFRYSVLYLSDGTGYFRACASSGISAEEEEYFRQHPIPDEVVAQLTSGEYRISESYFIPGESPIWKNDYIASFFVIVGNASAFSPSQEDQHIPASAYWRPEDFMIVPLMSGDNTLLGFLTADAPLDNLRPTVEAVTLLELFANQAAVVIEGARLTTELRDALKRAQESDQLKNHFLMMASHELRTPLTAIQGYLELLDTFGPVLDDESKTRFLSGARRACEELILLLNNVMDISRLDQEHISLNMEQVHVAKAVHLILEILEPTIVHQARPVEVNIPDDLSVWADDLRLRQVLLNLVSNALKYTPAPSKIAITAESVPDVELNKRLVSAHQQQLQAASKQFAVIAIKDWGPGVSLPDQARLFSKFVRLDSALNAMQRGSGLGLYLCRQLIEAMGGRIWLESQGIAGEGSAFVLALFLNEGKLYR